MKRTRTGLTQALLNSMLVRAWGLGVCVLGLGCGDDDAALPMDGAVSDVGDIGTADVATADAGSSTGGNVSFVPIYEAGSAWDSNAEARTMVDEVFTDFSAHLRTSGAWESVIEVYLSDDNDQNANTSFGGMLVAEVDGQSVRVVAAWASIVQNVVDEPASPDGANSEFSVHFNVDANSDNRGLLRHEMMHGLGAVNSLPNFVMTDADELTASMPGERIEAALYDLQLVDLDGERLLGNYAGGTYEVQPYRIETTLVEWMDGGGGIFFRGIEGSGSIDMECGTFPLGPERGGIVLNEPADVMSAGVHPTWDTIAAPDLAFFRAM
ncbi:MAG: hypothetical protein ACI9KE_005171, partial [Polyangiales bacterium]